MMRATFRRIVQPKRSRFPGSRRLLGCGAAMGYLMDDAASPGMEPYGIEMSPLTYRIALNGLTEWLGPSELTTSCIS